ncbi:5-carboxymethyl-2-hydroxymuconate Delta-isomerase [Acinetobacter silvestris]|uniref:5-carboxymethyl-2-hydroxymuconate isomerase n=1 Tax=Acinetobacter silvestris TaxID=1977882 RepID=A0A1Y3CGX3_9GAMM|nr:5-carboxymethyl-2-hydroxymuconate Delta-isomerase [Acinetobacter silvestris]OTG66376.1 5-carboxymethyl-2-hydroxymuconate isomerase [Acinetobacter silvestris]
MPQMIIDYSDNIQNLDTQKLMLGLNHTLFDTGLIDHADAIKTRIRAHSEFLIGFGDNQQAYIHVHICILTGRNSQEKQLIADQLSAFLQSFNAYLAEGLDVQLCVELTEMPKIDYRKTVVKF